MTMHTLGDIAARFGLELRGDPATPIHGVATLATAGAGQLGFLANPRYRAQLATTAPTRSCCAPPTPMHSRAPR